MSASGSRQKSVADFRRGQSVTVRSLNEILATLDADAKLEGMPFMPEMVPFCGKTFRVHRRAERTCVEGIGIRGMTGAVFLEGLRCDGSAHDGCQRGCLFFWKEAWLKPAEDGASITETAAPAVGRQDASQLPTMKGDQYFCQSTQLAGATSDLPPGRLRRCLRDMRIGEMTLPHFAYILWRALLNRSWKLFYGRAFFDVIGAQQKTVNEGLDLKAGEWVEIKSYAEIRATLDPNGRNRGLVFEPEMALHCGRRYRVATPLKTMISEESGKVIHVNNTVVLDGVVCKGICAVNCPRANYFFWREIWLKRVQDGRVGHS